MLKGKGGQPFYKDFWFWVKVLIFPGVELDFILYEVAQEHGQVHLAGNALLAEEQLFRAGVTSSGSSPRNTTTRPWGTA